MYMYVVVCIYSLATCYMLHVLFVMAPQRKHIYPRTGHTHYPAIFSVAIFEFKAATIRVVTSKAAIFNKGTIKEATFKVATYSAAWV